MKIPEYDEFGVNTQNSFNTPPKDDKALNLDYWMEEALDLRGVVKALKLQIAEETKEKYNLYAKIVKLKKQISDKSKVDG